MTDTPTLTAAQIEALAQQVEKMTPGTWEVCCDDDPQRIHRAPHLRVPTGRGTFYEPGKSGDDVRGLVALRNAAPALIAAARTLVKLRAMHHDADPFMAAYLEQAIARVLAETE